MPVFILAIIGTLGIIILSMVAGVSGPSITTYQNEARNAAVAAYVTTGTVPATFTVMGKDVSTDSFSSSVPMVQTKADQERLKSKKMVLEQAMVNVCLTLQARCGGTDITKLWAFLPSATGTMSDLLTSASYPTATTINCASAVAADYGNYGRYLLRSAINSTTDVSPEVISGVTKNYYYSAPTSSTGCGFEDIINLQ